jgi:uncharacterized protein
MTIILDTNCLIQILPKKAEHRWLYDVILRGEVILGLTTEILAEYEETLNAFFDSFSLGGNVCRMLLELPETRKIDVYFYWQLIHSDPDDNKYVDCAIAANADFIITNDAHFKILKNIDFPKVKCLSLEQFKEYFHSDKA